MEPSELLRYVSESLEVLGIPYLITGSIATIAYGEPRFTNDIDVVAELKLSDVEALCNAFPAPEFFLYEPAVRDAIRTRFPFNIIHPGSGLKVDVFPATDSALDQARLKRRVRIPGGTDFKAWFASPEDVIVKKLLYYQEGGSEKHIRDILGVLKTRGEQIDRAYIRDWADRLKFAEEWKLIIQRAGLTTDDG